MEVPKAINVRIADGIIETTDAYGGVLRGLFKHIHDTLNDKNDVNALKGLAEAHGYEVNIVSD